MTLSRKELESKYKEFLFAQTQANQRRLDPSSATYDPFAHARDRHGREEHGDTHVEMEAQIQAAALAILDVIAENNKINNH
tara:strand:+ start:338 stop:580 length:243 start_codon:yes stop_codon:yes gene_type:complete